MEKVINFDAIKANRAEMKANREAKKAERKAKKEAEKADKKPIGKTIGRIGTYFAAAGAGAALATAIIKGMTSNDPVVEMDAAPIEPAFSQEIEVPEVETMES